MGETSRGSGDGIAIRDFRGSWYRISTDFIKQGYGAEVGPYGIAVYNVLASYANNETQAAWPSLQTIAKLSGMSRRKAIEMVNQLEELGIIHVERHGDQRKPNEIYLLARDQWTSAPRALVESTSAPRAPDRCTTCTSTSAPRAPELEETTRRNNNNQGAARARADVAVVDDDESALNDQQREALMELESIGVQPKEKAKRLARDHDPDIIIGWCRYAAAADWSSNPPGYVIQQLRTGAPPPNWRQPARRGRPCPMCKGGTLKFSDPDTGRPVVCPRCGGSGHLDN